MIAIYYTVNDAGRILNITETTLRRWLTKYKIDVLVSPFGKVLVTPQGMEDLRNIIAVNEKIRELEMSLLK